MRIGVALATIAVVGLAVTGLAMKAPPSRVQATYEQERGYFYRLTAKFRVKATGEAVDFDYVVACNIKVTRWRDGGLSNDGTFSPRMIAKATGGGQAVMLKTLNACGGSTSESGDVPPDVLPMAVWFDSVADLSYGLAYVSEDAYDNPLGRLTFEGARVARATRAEWEAWRRQAADAYVQQGALPGPWGYDYPDNLNPNNPDIGRYVSWCEGYTRLPWPEEVKEGVRALWPPEQPRFWSVPNEEEGRLHRLLGNPKVASPPGVGPWAGRYGSPGSGAGSSWSGMPIRSGLWVGRSRVPERWPTETYPVLWPPAVSAHPVTVETPTAPREVYVHTLDFRDGALNGFAFCSNRQDGAGLRLEAVDPAWRKKPHVFVVDGQVVRRREDGQVYVLAPGLLVERDEYVFISFSTFL